MINRLLFYCTLTLLQLSCASDSKQQELPKTDKTEATGQHSNDVTSPNSLMIWYSKPQALWPAIITADNRIAQEMKPLTIIGPPPQVAKVTLGKKLFFDTNLSKNNTVSCATCHEPRMQFGDQRTTAIGINNQKGTRNTPNIFGIDHWQTFFWDGRANSAQEQALMPISNPIEMDLSIDEALIRINTDPSYEKYIQNAFGVNTLDKDNLAKAIVAFERTIELPQTRFARFLKANKVDPQNAVNILSEQELLGLHLFRTKAKCMTCHQGPLLSDNKFHVTGLHFYGRRFQDLGRFDATGEIADSGKFRTASLLFVSQTGPWMHNGLFSQFAGIVNFYNAGGARPKPRKHLANDPMFPTTSDLLPKLNLTKPERDALVAFLKTL